jgi:hypothetical protein
MQRTILLTIGFVLINLFAAFCATPAFPQQSIVGRSFDANRTGLNPNETVLTPAAIRAHGMKLLQTLTMPDDARGTEGQVLVVSGITMEDGLKHNVAYSATMADDVYAFDADTGALLWKQHIGNPIPDTLALDMWLTQGNWGILSTPVIDQATGTIYVDAMVSPTGQESNSQFVLHGLSLIDGHDQFPPLNLNQATYTSSAGRISKLGNVPRKQRPGLAFTSIAGRDTVFVLFGSFVEDANTNQGWIVAVDVTDLQPSIGAAFATTSLYSGAGIWMAGAAPAIDAGGDIYAVTGNGSMNGIDDFGNSIIRVHYTPPSGSAAGSLKIVQWFAPFDDTGRVGADPTLADTSLIPAGGYANEPTGHANMLSPKDQDLGSAGALLIPSSLSGYSKNVVFAAGKDGILYEVDADNMGCDHPADFAPALIAQNVYAKLLMPPFGFTFYPATMNLAPTDLATLQTTEFGYSHHQHGQAAFYKSPTIGPELITGGENGPVRAFTWTSDFMVHYQAAGGDYASANMPPPGGMPGSMIALSANGAVPNSCVIWATQPVGDANKTVTPGYLVAYQCDSFANGALVKIFDSRTAGIPFTFDKFDPPTPINGRVYVPSYDGRILVLGLGS